MIFQDIMNKVRQWDNSVSKWMMRHFYVIFFQFVLVCIFFGIFINTFKIIDISVQVNESDVSQKLNYLLVTNSFLIVLLTFLNSFWILFMFNTILRIQTVLRDISFGLSRQQQRPKNTPDTTL